MQDTRPNILFILTDQQRFDTIHALGNPVIKTPNLDRLVNEGTIFSRAYTPSPECCPARASLHYGQYPALTACYSNVNDWPDDEQNSSYVNELTQAGYRTHGVGKTHFAPRYQDMRGYQTRDIQEEVISKGGDDYIRELEETPYGHVFEPHGARGEMYYMPQPSALPAEWHPTQWVANKSIDFINSQKDSDTPWYLTTSIINPHPPFAPPSPWHKLYRAQDMQLPKVPGNLDSLLTYYNHFQNRMKWRDRGIDENHIRCMIAYYYACISFIDHQVGRLLDTLEENGQLENTLIVFTSDHGELLGDYNCFGKRSPHDSALRIPMICRHPETFEAGRQIDAPVNLIDLVPTFMEAAKVDLSKTKFQGNSLQSIHADPGIRNSVYAQLGTAEQALYVIATRKWKYAYCSADGTELLFDLEKDPLETQNRANTPLCREIQNELKQELMAHLRDGGQQVAIDGENWRSYPKKSVSTIPDEGTMLQDSQGFDWTIAGYKEENDDKGNWRG
ncbi:sulfatase family protein [Pelagicoccus mobilis]|uniref:Sulfatase-like hydrolase/transferase n=1 Tax=Pelagicoccus mobilis TaxID=415221 RepID=A0A934S232_9BACT|nr:sulfatase-like hydrolase/transferase [Pelagicoccus mobilis]MBK1880468.1 sulfatase-like hydrolase/transferase [Pelagicoccus mobilis]